MGLLDKATDAGSKTITKPDSVVLATPKAVAKAVAKAKPVAKVKAVKAVKAAKSVKAKKVKTTPLGLPENYDFASPNARRIGWFINFIINMGPIFGFLFAVAIFDAFTTIIALFALVALVLNIIVVPIMSGRTLGDFVSRTKNITSSGNKPNSLHAIFANSAGLLGLFGLVSLMIFAGSMFSTKGTEQIFASVWSVLGLIFIILFMVNYSMKRGSETKQGLYDSMFGAFLVKHVPAEGEVSTGFIGKLEGMATYGDRFTQRQEDKAAKKAAKELSVAAKLKEKSSDVKNDSSVEEKKSDDKKDKKKTK